MHALLEFDYAFLTYILHFSALRRGPKGGMAQYSNRGAWHNTPTLNTPLDVHVLMVTAY